MHLNLYHLQALSQEVDVALLRGSVIDALDNFIFELLVCEHDELLYVLELILLYFVFEHLNLLYVLCYRIHIFNVVHSSLIILRERVSRILGRDGWAALIQDALPVIETL